LSLVPGPRRVRRPPLPESVDVEIDGRPLAVAVRSPARAQRYSLRVPVATAPVLTIPPRGTLAEALDFLDRHRPWLAQRLARRAPTVAFADGAVVPFRGVDHVVRHSGKLRGGVTVVAGADGEPPVILVSGRPEFLARRLADFFRETARTELAAASRRHAEALGVRFRRVTIKDTRSRWGSCTATGDLAYSWRVVMAPPAVVDYLAAHEVAHLRELNHSARFWRLVATLCPDWRPARDWLRRNGQRLHAFGTA
jgi:predicted metal-dependent hydrolase